ncbi:hypothetical protein PR202_gb03077 [Eleusine coracana subsp. coracana]|uniref:BING4 C-terminal domain-containing protein n=1 Tax=Eleusine coracana subsp. coracana TaxID=191504 RepID=A0AAV5E1Y4_ELECO|nr:hypothetical protein PR202_gb03077 [Eleusine coracana subsp. coracana]
MWNPTGPLKFILNPTLAPPRLNPSPRRRQLPLAASFCIVKYRAECLRRRSSRPPPHNSSLWRRRVERLPYLALLLSPPLIKDDSEMVVKKYTRGKPVNVKRLSDKKLRGNLTVKENLYGQSAKAAAKADKWLKPTEDGGLEPEGLEKTYRFQQTDILKEVPLSSSRNAFDMNLPGEGPVRDVTFLHTEDMYAVAQKNFGQLHYQDVSTGEMTANYRTGLGCTNVMRVNPYNAVIGLGHSCGKVTMWKPTSVKPLVTMLCHSGYVTAVAFDKGGHLMATAARAQSLDFSQKGLLACSNGSLVETYKDFGGHDYKLYMKHRIAKGYKIGKVSFRPYKDILGIGHSMGLTSIIVPGSGEPNFDTFVDNPNETTKQKREKEVHALLDKLPPETIMLNSNMIATVRPPKKEKKNKKEIEEEMEEAIESAKKTEMKKKTKGRSKPSKRAKKKEEEVFRAKRPFLDQ